MRSLSNFVFLTLLISSIAACSNHSSNFTTTGSAEIKGGVAENQKWEDSLNFKRYSWFHEMLLIHDLMITTIDSKNSFNLWNSNDVAEIVKTCPQFFIVMYYSTDSKTVKINDLMSEFKKNSVKEVEIKRFSSAMKLHPDFVAQSFDLYKIKGFCKESMSPLVLNIPGYQTVELQ